MESERLSQSRGAVEVGRWIRGRARASVPLTGTDPRVPIEAPTTEVRQKCGNGTPEERRDPIESNPSTTVGGGPAASATGWLSRAAAVAPTSHHVRRVATSNIL